VAANVPRLSFMVIPASVSEVKGKSALALSRDLGLSYKSAFVLLHKLREAMAEEMRGRVIGGEGKVAEWMVDILEAT
jgi:molybdenum-dependent DNA-binding transcriptional regulator ModE